MRHTTARALSHTRVIEVVAAVALAAAATAVFGAPAQAATSAGQGSHVTFAGQGSHVTFAIPASVTTFSGSAGSARFMVKKSAASPASTTICTLTVNAPTEYFGGSYGGGEDGHGQIQCNLPVSELQILVVLTDNGAVASYTQSTTVGSSSVTADAQSPLSPGTYQTSAAGTVFWATGGNYSIPQTNSPTASLP